MFNVLDLIFLNLAFTVTFTGILINHFENYLPAFILKGYRYGSFAYKGSGANFLDVLEIQKAYYRHFYLFSSVFSAVALVYMYCVYYLGFAVNPYIRVALQSILRQDEPSVSVVAAVIAMFLITLQCARRFYETYYMQVFAKSSKMNLSHYLAGIVHYFSCIVVTVGVSPLFTGDQNREKVLWNDFHTTLCSVPCVLTFLWAWYEQYQSNVILANLRKDKKSGKIVTENHGVPYGRMFEKVSSPHRLCEIILYSVLLILVPCRTFFCIYLWVISNQIQCAIQAHEWYKKTFKNYPQHREALFPMFL